MGASDHASAASRAPFIAVNCAPLSNTTRSGVVRIEEKTATGDADDGKVEHAHGGHIVS